MNQRFWVRFWVFRFRRVLASVAAVLVVGQASEAGLTLGSSAAQVVDSLNTTSSTGVAGAPQFTVNSDGSNGVLLTPGGGLPILTGTAAGFPFQVNSTSSLVNSFVVNSATLPNNSNGNGVPAAYGTAGTAIFAQGTGQQGALTTQGGIFWDTRTTLTDNISPTSQGLASLSFSTATATFTNLTSTSITIDPAGILSVKGSISGLPGSYVAAGLTTSIFLPGSTNPINLTPIALAANQAGLTVNSTGNASGDASSVSFSSSTGQFSATATSYYTNITLGVGQSLTIEADLTLISDPGSTISIVSDLAPGFQGPLPVFGAMAGGPFSVPTVPEPSTILMLGLGLSAVGAWRVQARRLGPARA